MKEQIKKMYGALPAVSGKRVMIVMGLAACVLTIAAG
jgi:hypothetical protein